jgi:endonuclease YncB( thermonuclease family)
MFVLGLAVGASIAPGGNNRAMGTIGLDTAAAASAARPAPTTTIYPAEVLRVIDGDTFDARVRAWPGMDITTRVRLRDIDAAEFNGRCEAERRLAQEAYDALAAMLTEGGVTIGRISFDKYGGRMLADAATRRTADVATALLDTGLVRRYSGGRRASWCG